MTEHKNLAAALIAAQQAFGDVTKGKRVDVKTQKGAYSYTYADLGTVLDAVMPALHANGLTIVQAMGSHGEIPCIETILLHADSSGELHSWTPIYWADKTDTQKYGGAITYCRRYAIMALLCLNAEDDDGQHARQPAPKRDVVARNDVNQQTGEIAEPADAGIQLGLIRRIAMLGGSIGKTEEEIKESMRKVYARDTPAEEFSRKSLSVDQLQQYLDLLNKTVAKSRTVEVVQ